MTAIINTIRMYERSVEQASALSYRVHERGTIIPYLWSWRYFIILLFGFIIDAIVSKWDVHLWGAVPVIISAKR